MRGVIVHRRIVSGFVSTILGLLTIGVASALPLTAYHARPGDTLDIFVSGSSAQDNALERLFRLQCAPDSLDIYRAGGNQRVFFCSFEGREVDEQGVVRGAVFEGGRKVAFHKSSVGGSGYGVGPVVQRTSVQFVNMADLKRHADERCVPSKRSRRPADPPFDGYVEHVCVNPKPLSMVPDAGVSDVEPRIFAGNFGFSPERLGELTVRSANAFVFGIPVTLNLRDALQAAQFDEGSPCHPAHPDYARPVATAPGIEGTPATTHAESEACMPGLTRAQLAGLFAGTLTDWRLVVNARGYPLAAANAATGAIDTPPGVTPPADTRPYLCRRWITSGTQASYEMFFLNQRCAPGVDEFVEASATTSLGTGTSNVKSCLNDRHEKNLWAVGIFSTENVPDPGRAHWRFIKMDRVAPTLLNTFNGRWPFFVEQTIQWRNDKSERPLSGERLTLMDHISRQAGRPEIIRALNLAFVHPFGDAGVMALNTNGHRPPVPTPEHPVTAAVVAENPVLPLTRASLGSPNNCNPPLVVYPTPAP